MLSRQNSIKASNTRAGHQHPVQRRPWMRIAPCRDPELLDNELCSALDLHPVDAHRLSLLQQHLSPCHPGAAQQGRSGQQLLRMFKVRSLF